MVFDQGASSGLADLGDLIVAIHIHTRTAILRWERHYHTLGTGDPHEAGFG
jgi:hypothetical protein